VSGAGRGGRARFLITWYRTLLNSPGVYRGIILVLLITGAQRT
jgi:hypothetical protein